MTSEEILSLVESAGLDAAVEPPAGVAAGAVTVTVPADSWLTLLALARDRLGCDFFDWLGGVDEAGAGVAVLAHVYSLAGRHHLLLRTRTGWRPAPAAHGHRCLPGSGLARAGDRGDVRRDL